jgi:hypothetical protein
MMLSRDIKEYESGMDPARGSLYNRYIKPHAAPANINWKAQTTNSDFCKRMSSSSSGSEPILEIDNNAC